MYPIQFMMRFPFVISYIEHIGDPCYELEYPSKGGGGYYIKNNKFVCITRTDPKRGLATGWGGPSYYLSEKVKGADKDTFVIYEYSKLASDKKAVYIDGFKTDIKVDDFKFDKKEGDRYLFFIGNKKYKLNDRGNGYEELNY